MVSQDLSSYHIRLHKTLKNRHLLPQKSKLLIAVSGGQDSLCLARLCLDLQAKFQWHIAIAHYDHGWAMDQGLVSHVAQICQHWQVPLFLETASEKIPETEASARQYRYQALTKIATQHRFNFLLTGHTLSDRSETFLYNLLRGAGIEGLTSLNWSRKLTDNLTLIRPLLNFTRQETLEFCQQYQLPIWQDKYNQQKKFARNRIRLDLIPYLEANFNPRTQQHLAQTAEILRADLEYLDAQTEAIFADIYDNNSICLNRTHLASQPLNLQRRVIKKFLEIHLSKMPNFDRIEEVLGLISAPNRSCSSTLAGNFVVRVEDQWLCLIQLED